MDKKIPALIVFSLMLLTNPAMASIYNIGDLNFNTTDQSLWGSGSGIVPTEVMLNLDLNSSLTLGGISGDANEVIIPGQSAITKTIRVPDGYLKSYSYWGSCTTYGVTHGCWKAGTKWVDTSYNKEITIFPEINEVTADTRFGTEVKLSTHGKVELKSNFGVNGGSVNASVDYTNVELEIPDNIVAGTFFNLNPKSTVNTKVTTKSPTLQGSISSSINYSVDYSATACFTLGSCSTSGGNIFNLPYSETKILEVNTDNLDPDKARILGINEVAGIDATFDATKATLFADIFALPSPGVYISGIPALPKGLGPGINVLELALDAPGRFDLVGDTNGNVNASTTVNDIVRVDYDLGSYNQVPTGGILQAGNLTFRGDILDVDLTPTLDYKQDITFNPDLMVELQFDKDVYIQRKDLVSNNVTGCLNGAFLNNNACYIKEVVVKYNKICVLSFCYQSPVSSTLVDKRTPSNDIHNPIYKNTLIAVNTITAPWDNLPPIALIDDQELNVVPKFWINNEFKNNTSFNYDVNVALGLLKGSVKYSVLGLWDDCLYCDDTLISNLGDFGAFDETFQLEGFNTVTANTFSLRTASLTNSSPNAVPEPSILMLMSLGLFILMGYPLTLSHSNKVVFFKKVKSKI